MAEIEEAIDPSQYRIRMLLDNDRDYDYSADLNAQPGGSGEIVVCLERIEQPSWARELETQERPIAAPLNPSRYPPAGARTAVKNLVVSPDDAPIRRIIVLKLDHRGDFIMAQNAFGLLKNSFPQASMTLVCGPWNEAQAAELGLFERIIGFDFFPEDASSVVTLVSLAERFARFRKLLGDASYDLAIDLRIYEDTRDLLRFTNARITAGLDSSSSFQWLTIPLNLPIPTRHGRAQSDFIGAKSFLTRLGDHRGFEIVFEKEQPWQKAEHLTWGPYIDLGAGNFEFEILIEPIGSGCNLLFDISANGGREIAASDLLTVLPKEYPRISVTARRPLHQFEFRLGLAADGPIPKFRFRGLRFIRAGLVIGMHQEEAMALLVHLVHLRLKHPFVTTVER